MKRQIIQIDHTICNGCGNCVPNCPEGAIQMIDGKARLISDIFCDGLGACIGECPLGAITTIEREAEAYNESKTMDNIVKQGENTIKAHLLHLKSHGQKQYLTEAIAYLKDHGLPVPDFEPATHHSCPGSRIVDRRDERLAASNDASEDIASELRQWPVQLHLVNPEAPYFYQSDLLVCADCVAFSFGNFHRKFLRGKTLVVFCPKLDSGLDAYVDKLAQVFANQEIKSVTVARMEVPCCGGTLRVVSEAMKAAGISIPVKEVVVSLDGRVLKEG